jgi:filamentous hemagglutinin family protein
MIGRYSAGICLLKNSIKAVSELAFVLSLGWPPPVRADIALDGGMGPAGSLSGPDYVIPADVGTQVGGNLFHSFGTFDVHANESATFSGPTSIHNVLGRVTGGNASNINGLLRSTIPDANLYLLNPAGIVFGPDASLDVKGSFHATTADYVRLEDGGRFDATQIENTVLTTAPVEAFGFLDRAPGPISVDRATLEVPDGKDLALIGGDLSFQGVEPDCRNCAISGLYARGGRLYLVSTASTGEAVAGDSGFDLESFDELGTIESRHMGFSTRPISGGTVYIRAGQLLFAESMVSASHEGDADHPGIGIDIDIRGAMILIADQYDFEMASSASGAGRAGDISIHAGRLELHGNSEYAGNIGARVFSTGHGGDIYITAGEIEVDRGAISAQVFGSGKGGDILIHADTLEISGKNGTSFISSSTFDTGDAGDLTIDAREITIRGGAADFTGLATQVSSAAKASPTGGVLRLRVGTLNVLSGGQISAGIFAGAGRAGNIEIHADDTLISGSDDRGYSSGIYSNVNGDETTGSGGDIRLVSGSLRLEQKGQINARSLSSGHGGSINVQADAMKIKGGAYLSVSGQGLGASGNIEIETEELTLDGTASPQYWSTGIYALTGAMASDGGSVRILTDDFRLLNGGIVSTQTYGSGRGGDIEVFTDRALISGRDEVNDSSSGLYAGTRASSQSTDGAEVTGSGGDIRIKAGQLQLESQGQINARSYTAGQGGNIDISANDIEITGGAFVSVTGARRGAAGSIKIETDRLTLDGTASPQDWLTGVFAITGQEAADGGAIHIMADDIRLLNGGVISTKTFGPAGGGDIEIVAERLVISGRDDVNDWSSALDAGTAVSGQQVDDATGPGGRIDVQAQRIDVTDQGVIIAKSESAGDGGNIRLAADAIYLRDGASVTAASSNTGNAGNIALVSNRLQLERSDITTGAELADGGNILIRVRDRVHLRNGRIIAEVKSGTGRGGNIDVDPVFIILDESRISADAFGGPGGNIVLVADHFIATPDSSVTASSSLGIDGNVMIDAPDTDIDAGLTALPIKTDDAAEVILSPCTAGGRADAIHLAVKKYEVLPDSPYALRAPNPALPQPPGTRTSWSDAASPAIPTDTERSWPTSKCPGDD